MRERAGEGVSTPSSARAPTHTQSTHLERLGHQIRDVLANQDIRINLAYALGQEGVELWHTSTQNAGVKRDIYAWQRNGAVSTLKLDATLGCLGDGALVGRGDDLAQLLTQDRWIHTSKVDGHGGESDLGVRGWRLARGVGTRRCSCYAKLMADPGW